MNVLVLGSGGREHAISWKIAKSSMLNNLYIAPGNAGTSTVGKNVQLNIEDFEEVKSFVLENQIDLVVVGPEIPLVNGIADFFEADTELSKVTLIGPKKEGAMLEGSKDFAKKFMAKYNVPTAKYKSFDPTTLENGYAFLDSLKAPYVLKADGLAGGKGVLIIESLSEAKAELKNMLSAGKFGSAGNIVVIEEFLKGIELSVFIITDGKFYKILPEAKDYKRIGEGDTGLNTGGMGAVSPVPFAGRDFIDKVENQIIIPTIKGLRAEKIDYSGFLFIGLMKVNGDPYVIEYNVRLGDPESEVIIPRLKSDLLDLFEGIATDTLSERDVEFDPRTCLTVMKVAGGYPEAYEKGKTIVGLNAVDEKKVTVFHAGTKEVNGAVVSNGGRVLTCSAMGKDIESARKLAYENIEKVQFDSNYCRKDIGLDLTKKPQKA